MGLRGRSCIRSEESKAQWDGEKDATDRLRWYAIRTRSRHEKAVSDQLTVARIENFLPLATEVRRWSDRKKLVEVPLFSGYAFVRLVYSSPDRVRALQTHGVVDFVGVHGSGSPIPDNQMDTIRTIVANKVSLRNHAFLRIGQRVRIQGGALDGVEGILAAEGSDRSLIITIEPIERSLSIRVEGYNIEAV